MKQVTGPVCLSGSFLSVLHPACVGMCVFGRRLRDWSQSLWTLMRRSEFFHSLILSFFSPSSVRCCCRSLCSCGLWISIRVAENQSCPRPRSTALNHLFSKAEWLTNWFMVEARSRSASLMQEHLWLGFCFSASWVSLCQSVFCGSVEAVNNWAKLRIGRLCNTAFFRTLGPFFQHLASRAGLFQFLVQI